MLESGILQFDAASLVVLSAIRQSGLTRACAREGYKLAKFSALTRLNDFVVVKSRLLDTSVLLGRVTSRL